MTTAPSTDTHDAVPDCYSLARVLRHARGSDQARTAAKVFIGKQLTNAETGIRAVVSNGSLDKMLHESSWKKSVSRQAHSQAIANVDTLFALATRRLSRADRKGAISIKAVHHFDAPMPFDGQVLQVKMLVKELADKNAPHHPLYTLSTVEIQQPSRLEEKVDGLKRPLQTESIPTEGGSGSTVLDGYEKRFAAMVAEVKRGMQLELRPIARRGESLNSRDSAPG